MNHIKSCILLFASLVVILPSTPARAQKHLIFLDGYLGWYYSMPPYLTEHHAEIEALPFSGFCVVGNVFTSYVMSAAPNNNVTYERVWNEVKSLQGVYRTKTENFLVIQVDWPGDFWDDAVWQRTTANFAAVARAAKNLGFKGILFDDEPYAGDLHHFANYMSNFKFPKKADVQANPDNFADWEVAESEHNRGDWVDYSCRIGGQDFNNSEDCSYRNPAHNFKEHMDKVAARFKAIMEAMEAEFPKITLLVLHGPATAHPNTNIDGHYIKPNSIFETNEYKGAMFLGFKQGLHSPATLHDMGEFYQYHTNQQFQDAYQWRKHDIVSEQYNQGLDDSYRWIVPEGDRATWSRDVQVGFMVSDYGRPHSLDQYNIPDACRSNDVQARLDLALTRSDDYVIFYSDSSLSRQSPQCANDNIGWLDVDGIAPEHPVSPQWREMMQGVYDSIHRVLDISGVHVEEGSISEHTARIIWDVSDYATGQVEYGITANYGQFSTKETSFNYNQHGQLLHNLLAGSTYHYRVISEDRLGNRAASADYQFTTLGISVSSPVRPSIFPLIMPVLLQKQSVK